MAVMFEGCDFPCCFLDRVVVPSVISVGIAGNLFILAVLRRDKICQRFQGFMHACMRYERMVTPNEHEGRGNSDGEMTTFTLVAQKIKKQMFSHEKIRG